MEELRYSESVVIARPPEEVWRLVSDVTRTGEWSPVCQECWWETEDRDQGAWFGGRNVNTVRTWETRSQVAVSEPCREFAWRVGAEGAWGARWAYRLDAVEEGTGLSEDWQFLPTGHAVFEQKYGERAAAEIAERTAAARQGIPETLARIRKIAESA